MKKITNQFNGMVRTKRNLGTNGGDCIDNNPNCASWAKTGLCKINEKWMDKICKKSCGKCPNDENRNAAAITELRKKVEEDEKKNAAAITELRKKVEGNAAATTAMSGVLSGVFDKVKILDGFTKQLIADNAELVHKLDDAEKKIGKLEESCKKVPKSVKGAGNTKTNNSALGELSKKLDDFKRNANSGIAAFGRMLQDAKKKIKKLEESCKSVPKSVKGDDITKRNTAALAEVSKNLIDAKKKDAVFKKKFDESE